MRTIYPSTTDPLKEVEDVFLAGMASSYSEDAKKTTIAELPGSQVLSFESGVYRLSDCCLVCPYSGQLEGTTLIWREDVMIWTRRYSGRCDEIARAVIDTCLRETYCADSPQFYGGRGPTLFYDRRYHYVNQIKKGSSFRNFSGQERVWSPENKLHGHIRYSGGFHPER